MAEQRTVNNLEEKNAIKWYKSTVVGLVSAMASCSAPVCWLSHMKQ